MKPNQSHVAGLALALELLSGFTADEVGDSPYITIKDWLSEAKSAPAEVAQGEAVKVVGYQWLDTAHFRKNLPNFAQNQPKQDEFRPLMTVAQHNRIVAALTAPQPDAELMELLQRLRSMYRRGDLDVWTCVDAKLASLRN
jgi:hypothetical protein